MLKKRLDSRNLSCRRINACLLLRQEQKLLSNGDARYYHNISIIFKPYATFLCFYCLNLLFNSAVCCWGYIIYTWWMDDWMNENGKLVEWYWQGKREVLIEKPVPLPLFHISHMDWSGIEPQPAWWKHVIYPPKSWCGHIYVTQHCHYFKCCLIIFGLSLKSDFYNGARATNVTQLWDEVVVSIRHEVFCFSISISVCSWPTEMRIHVILFTCCTHQTSQELQSRFLWSSILTSFMKNLASHFNFNYQFIWIAA